MSETSRTRKGRSWRNRQRPRSVVKLLDVRGGIATAPVLLALLVAAPTAGAGPKAPSPAQSMTVTGSPRAAKARPVRLALTLRYKMQCGYPGAGPLIVTFPSALKLPQRLAADAAELAVKPIVAMVKGRRVTVAIPPHKGVLCGVVGPGSVTVTFTRAAKLANPARAGSYNFSVTHDKRAFTVKRAG